MITDPSAKSLTLQHATQVFQETVPPVEVARYYLTAELPNIISSTDFPIHEAIMISVRAMPEERVLRFLEAISDTYRRNGVFRAVANNEYSWMEVELPISAILLSGVSEAVDVITHSEAIGRSPIKFAAHLQQYFQEHPDSDPQKLDEFRPQTVADEYARLITREHEGQIIMLDGIHRLIQLVRLGHESVRVYAAVLTSPPAPSV